MKFYVHKLGCPKNDVDGDYIAARLLAAGHEPVRTPEEAESIIVNTCGFILPAKEESIAEILRLARLKQAGHAKWLYATGCLAQRYGDEIMADMPELDGAFGLGALDDLARAVASGTRRSGCVRVDARRLRYLDWPQRYVGDDFPYAYLKISDGCNWGCTYCAIPAIRGSYRSRPRDAVVAEARFLAGRGKKELVLVSQDATRYGCDVPDRPSIVDLLKDLEQVHGVRWLRLMYLHPAGIDRTLIEYLAGGGKTLNYFDLPLQHIDSQMLAAMGRAIDRSGIERLIRQIRTISPDATLRTTFMVGFPGETRRQFQQLCDFVCDIGFDRLGVFTYSREEETPAAQLKPLVSDRVAANRADILMNLQREIAFARNDDLKGTVQEVIIDSVDANGTTVGRTRADCPEIDQQVRLRDCRAHVGQIVNVRIDETDGYDLIGKLIEATI